MSVPSVEIDQLSYDAKPTEYFQCLRPEMLEFVPQHCRRMLDVGCAEGDFGASIKRTREVEVWGVEPTKSAATAARAKLDRVIEGVFAPETALPARYFDCIIFNDVLEHMLAPEVALRYANSLLAPGGVVVASIPNIRYLLTVYDLLVRARWDYVDAGPLDKTHLRFFARSNIVELFEREGFAIDRICGINAWTYKGPSTPRKLMWRAYRLANILSRGKIDDMRFLQFAVVAKPRDQLAERDNGKN